MAYLFIVKNIAAGTQIKFLDFINIEVKTVKEKFWGGKEITESANMLALYEILQAFTVSKASLKSLEVLSL